MIDFSARVFKTLCLTSRTAFHLLFMFDQDFVKIFFTSCTDRSCEMTSFISLLQRYTCIQNSNINCMRISDIFELYRYTVHDSEQTNSIITHHMFVYLNLKHVWRHKATKQCQTSASRHTERREQSDRTNTKPKQRDTNNLTYRTCEYIKTMNCSCFILLFTQAIFLFEILATFALMVTVQVLNPEWNDTSTKFTCSILSVICLHQLGSYMIAGEGRAESTVDVVKSGLLLYTGIIFSFLLILMSYDEDSVVQSDQYFIALIVSGGVLLLNVSSFLALTYWSDILVPMGIGGEIQSYKKNLQDRSIHGLGFSDDKGIYYRDYNRQLFQQQSYSVDQKQEIRDNHLRGNASNMVTPLLDQTQLADNENETYINDDESLSVVSNAIQKQNMPDNDLRNTSPTHGIIRLLELTKPEKKELVIGCVILMIRLPFSLSIPHFVSEVIGALNDDDFDTAKRNILDLFIAGTIDAMLDFWCVYLFGRVKEKIVLKLRSDTLRAILRQERDFFDSKSSGELASRLTSDCGAMAADLTWFYRFSIEACVRVFVIVVYMFLRCSKLAIASCAIIPIVALVNKFYGDWLQTKGKQVQDVLAKSNKTAQEALSCIQTVLSFASEEFECMKYTHQIEKNYHLNIQLLFATGVYFMLVATFLINTCVKAAILFLGTMLIMQNQLEIHVLLSFILYQDQLQEYCMALASSYSSLMRCSGKENLFKCDT